MELYEGKFYGEDGELCTELVMAESRAEARGMIREMGGIVSLKDMGAVDPDAFAEMVHELGVVNPEAVEPGEEGEDDAQAD